MSSPLPSRRITACALALASFGAIGCSSDTMDTTETEERREIGSGFAGGELPTYPRLEIPDGAPRVAFLGDSITAGYHLGAEHSYAAAAQRDLFAEGVPFELVNAGVSGDTSRGGLARLPRVLETEPDVVVIALGANDGLRALSLDALEANLRAIVEGVRAAGAEPVLLGMQAPPNLGEYAEDFDALYPFLAEELEVAFVPSFLDGVGGVPELNLSDGIHPTVEGHRKLAENIAPTLRQVVGQ